MLSWFDVPIETGAAEREGANARFAAVQGPARFKARDVLIPGDVLFGGVFS